MTEQRTIAFSKMSGLGNDFIIIDARENALALTPAQVRQLATRDNQITKGCDQLLVLHPPKSGGDIFMQIFNADGGQVEACGNGARAVVKWLAANSNGEALIEMETLGGGMSCQFFDEYADVVMPRPTFGWRDIPLSEEIADTSKVKLHEGLPPAFLVNVGNPHAVFFIEDGKNVDHLAREFGKQLMRNPLFAREANISFFRIQGEPPVDEILLDIATWERGAGLTQACGTGACAVAIAAAHHRGWIDISAATPTYVFPPFARRNNPHRDDEAFITVHYDPENGTLSQIGPATLEFNGEITL